MAGNTVDGACDWHAVVLADRVIARRPDQRIGPAALIGQLIPRILHVTSIATVSDRGGPARICAELFARAAVHGGFATNAGRTWNTVTSFALGDGDTAFLLASIRTLPADAGALFTTEPDGSVTLRMFDAAGTPIGEDSGLGALRARLATGRPALPVNNHALGTLDDRRATRPATSKEAGP